MSKITWLHFSDVHMKAFEDFNRSKVLNALWVDLKEGVRNRNVLPNFIVFTGDLTHSGQEAEYERFGQEFMEPLCRITGIEKNRVYFVPGNHDFNRNFLKNLNKGQVQKLNDRDAVNDFLKDEETREMYLKPFQAYADFVKRFTQGNYFEKHPAYGYCDNIEVAGRTLSIIGLNSAWACNFSEEEEDQAHLLIGEHQVSSALNKVPENAIVITLQHHPFNWLADFDTAAVKTSLTDKSWFIHHGHVHRANEINVNTSISANKAFIFGVAAAYDKRVGDDHYTKGYTINTLDLSENEVCLKVRKYVDSPHPRWTANEDLMGEGTGGEKRFSLSDGIIKANTQQKKNTNTYATLDELFRASPQVAARLPEYYSRLTKRKRTSTFKGSAELHFEDMLCGIRFSSLPHASRNELDVIAFAALYNSIILQELETAVPNNLQLLESYISATEEFLSAHYTTESQQELIKQLSICWKTLSKNWHSAPYSLVRELGKEKLGTLVLVSFLAILALLVTRQQWAFAFLPIDQALTEEEGQPLLNDCRIRMAKNNCIEVFAKTGTTAQFIFISMIRFYAEARLEQLIEVLSSCNQDFPISLIQFKIQKENAELSERRFTIDTNQAMHLLMGKQLYELKSGSVWFRELLQNAMDACAARSQINPAFSEPVIELNYHPARNKFVIRDNGIGMSLTHINKFFCKVGRSIWRSEELINLSADKNPTRLSIGKFGIGFLSVFEVARYIEIKTRFCLDQEGYMLKITDPQQPFFCQQTEECSAGTEITLFFKEAYKPEIAKLAAEYLTYIPGQIRIAGLQDFATNAQEALNNLVGKELLEEGLEWQRKELKLPMLEATLWIAIPLPTKKFEKTQKTFPASSTIRVSNGGITIYEKQDDWLGEEKKYDVNPRSGLNGIKAILEFDQGAAPVSVSRNGIRIDDTSASLVLDSMIIMATDAWWTFAEEHFDSENKSWAQTKQILSILEKCVKPPSYGDSWTDKRPLLTMAKKLLLKYGAFEIFQGTEPTGKRLEAVEDLDGDTEVLITTRELFKSNIFRLYCTQKQNIKVIILEKLRDIRLLADCHFKWCRISTDDEMYNALQINEDKSFKLNQFIPAEVALVSNKYFPDNDYLLTVLPGARARIDQIVDVKRINYDQRPRILANKDHIIWTTIENKLNEGKVARETVSTLVDLLFHIAENKSITRRGGFFKSAIPKFLQFCELPDDTVAKI